MVQLDLQEHAVALESLEPASDPDSQALAVRTWRGRMLSEHASARVYAELLPMAMQAEVPADLQYELATMIEDELRHARQCAGVVQALGEVARGDMAELVDIPRHATVSRKQAFFRNVLSVSCLSETVAVALIDAERLEMSEPVLADVMRTILADEVRHARFGWRLMSRSLDEETSADLARYLPVALAHLEQHETASLGRDTPSAEAQRLGACDGPFAVQLFYDTVEQVILPKLKSLGFDAEDAWARRPHAGAYHEPEPRQLFS